ncbi:hypothetical protein Ahy_A09g046371 isoform C [Arachis hypogaea]|uniref:Isopropylmalate dehydrogenase-like domain-containing protein n=1 Tax=Arachis hypogaea TaxID=3818 RepID=A0A445BPQ8_ARAHY|nr:hypothetical protein Ahy_A09g046371 isoform C [Arachis hypogaea]
MGAVTAYSTLLDQVFRICTHGILCYSSDFYHWVRVNINTRLRQEFGKSNCFTAEWCSMLRHLNLHDKADLIQNAILNTIAEGKYQTADLGGKAKTTEFTNAIIDHL